MSPYGIAAHFPEDRGWQLSFHMCVGCLYKSVCLNDLRILKSADSMFSN